MLLIFTYYLWKSKRFQMKNVLAKVPKIGKTLWEHKKKSAFAGFLVCLGGNYATSWLK